MAAGGAGGSLFTIRTTVSTDDVTNPNFSTAVNLGGGYDYGYLYCTLGGTTPSWNVTPLFNDDDNDAFADGSTFYGVSGAAIKRYKINLANVMSFQCRCDGKSGTSPTIAITLEAFSRYGV